MKLASIEIIKELRPHSNADRLELATVLGWQTIVKKGEFAVGDRVVFIVIDTILPDAPWSAFLKKGDSVIRLRTVKLRGEYSQGLVLPLSVLPEHMHTWQIGADVGGELGVTKYEKEIPAQLSGEAIGAFPAYIVSKTDEDNALSNPALVDHVLSQGPLTITQKLDGSSMTVVLEVFGDCGLRIAKVCSRNLELKETDANAFWKAARDLTLTGVNVNGDHLILQGELMGPGIQGNQLELKKPQMFLYQARDMLGWKPYHDLITLHVQLRCGLVPFVTHYSVPLFALPSETIPALIDIADSQVLPNGKPAEGIVVRPIKYPASGTGRPLGFKLINRNYGE
jgi:RNA ligase (TIGR02306 family)